VTTWMTLKELSDYSRLSPATLKRATHRSFNRLPSHLIEGRRLFSRDEYDRWALGLRAKAETKTAQTLAKLGL
jgi:hypothetical protein